MKRILLFGLLAGVGVAEPFRQNERVAFVGDSITHGGSYHTLVQYFYATRYPKLSVACYNLGISGDNAYGATQRTSAEADSMWKSDVRSYKPTAAAIMLGMNDVGGWQFESSGTKEELIGVHEGQLKLYTANYETLLDNLETLGADQILLIKSSPYDQTMVNTNARPNLLKFGFGKNDAIVDFGKKVIDEESETRGYPICDFNTPMLNLNAEQQKLEPAFSIIGPDRIHPGDMGHVIMGYTFLKFQGLESSVAEVILCPHAIPKGKWGVRNCVISSLKMGNNRIQFDYTPKSLPMVEQSYKAAGELIPFEEEFNQEELKVIGLAEGTYKLTIGSESVGTFSHEQFSAGVNLALENTPQRQQSQMVYLLCLKQKETMSKIRAIVWAEGYLGKIKGHDATDQAANLAMIEKIEDGFEPEGVWGAPSDYYKGMLLNYTRYIDAYENLIASVDGIIKGIYTAAQPMTYRVSIVKIK